MQALPDFHYFLNGVIVVFMYLAHSEGVQVVGGQLRFLEVLDLDLVVRLVLCL